MVIYVSKSCSSCVIFYTLISTSSMKTPSTELADLSASELKDWLSSFTTSYTSSKCASTVFSSVAVGFPQSLNTDCPIIERQSTEILFSVEIDFIGPDQSSAAGFTSCDCHWPPVPRWPALTLCRSAVTSFMYVLTSTHALLYVILKCTLCTAAAQWRTTQRR